MKLMILFFPSVDELVRFRWAIDPKVYEANLREHTLFCLCNEEQVELANYVYGAHVLELQPSYN